MHISSLKKEAMLWLALLGPLFFGAYGFTNWYSASLPEVNQFYFGWEQNIPVVPWMIVPYMSIDLFFAGALFLCVTRQELHGHVKRVAFAISVSAACFLLYPMQFSFPRPEVDGFYGVLFDVLYGFDQPFNQAPSLHISLLMFLWVVYASHTKGLLNGFIHVWFALIGLSVLFTHQHHFVDIPTAMLVGAFGFYLFPNRQDYGGFPSGFHRKLVLVYGAMAILLLIMAFLAMPYSLLFLWPALALTLVAMAYSGAGTRVFRKWQGGHSISSRVLLAPYRLAAYCSYRMYTRADTPTRKVAENLLMGRMLSNKEAQQLCEDGVVAVVDMAPEFATAKPFRRLACHHARVLDLTPPNIEQLQDAVDFIEVHRAQGVVYVHCALGYSRSAAVVVAWLLKSGAAQTVDEAVEQLRNIHPKLVLNAASLAVLQSYSQGAKDFS
ncbi:MAG: phosphatase PAP2/dual specificity phosphatase family protein [Alphaproteobacteria bacterium]|nr:phosphatase PAP2/dual specificity phosphatase family protein [Alphaproteobacteria bacterium]